MRLNDADRARVTAAVTQAEATTDGEIVTIVARQSDKYHDVALHWAILAMLFALALISFRPLAVEHIYTRFVDPWVQQPPIGALFGIALVLIVLVFLLARAVLAWMPLRFALAPGATKTRRVHARALILFHAAAEKRTRAKTGVLLYLSIAERRAEIVADAAIHARVAPEVWGAAMEAVLAGVRDGLPADGMADAVARIGAILTDHFPRSENRRERTPRPTDRALTKMGSETVWAGRFLTVQLDGAWEYAARQGDIAAAVIVAIDDGHIILVEQYRVPIGRACLELPAGLVGDETAGESVTVAAGRELEEETGYRAALIEDLGLFYSSPGMTSEAFTLVRATGLTKIGDGGGVEDENITVHRVKLTEVPAFVAAKRAEGVAVDAKMLLILAGGII